MKHVNVWQSFYYQTLRIHLIEKEVAKRYPEGNMRCPVHLSIGQEINAVAISFCIDKRDYMVSTHRSHAHYLAKGGSLKAFISELYGKVTGCSRGQGGSMHLIDESVNFMGSTSIVGGTIPIGVGLAWASKLKGDNRKSVVCIGEAATEQGVFWESLNFSVLHKLPVIFYCENNLYSCFTHIKDRQGVVNLEKKVSGWCRYIRNTPDYFMDTKSAIDCHITNGPIFIEVPSYRWVEHCGPNEDDNLNYRSSEEIFIHKRDDRFELLKEYIFSNKILSKQENETMIKDINEEIKEAFIFAGTSPFPDESELGKYLYA